MIPPLLSLEVLKSDDPQGQRQSIGGKANGLLLALEKGIEIPPSLVIPTSVVTNFLNSLPTYSHLQQAWRTASDLSLIEKLLDPLHREIKEVVASTGKVHGSKKPVFPWIEALVNHSKRSRWDKIILRSSINIEDSTKSSLAGCFPSRVTDVEPEALTQNLVSVLQGIYSLSALSRVATQGIFLEDFRPAILVQPYLVSPWAGVAFSRHPNQVWQRPKDSRFFAKPNGRWGLVEGSQGGAEAICQGESPTQKWQLGGPRPEGISGLAWRQLQRSLRILDRSWGGPVDVEWLVQGNRLLLIQARRVVTEESRLIWKYGDRIRLDRTKTAERFPTPMTPLGWDVLQPSIQSATRELEGFLGVQQGSLGTPAVAVGGSIYARRDVFSLKRVFPFRVRTIVKILKKIAVVTPASLGLEFKQVLSRKSFSGGIRYIFAIVLDGLMKEKIVAVLRDYDQRREILLRDLPVLEKDVGEKFAELDRISLEIPVPIVQFVARSLELGSEFMASDFTVFFAREWLAFSRRLKNTGSPDDDDRKARQVNLHGVNPSTAMLWDLGVFLRSLRSKSQESKAQIFLGALKQAKNLDDLKQLAHHLESTDWTAETIEPPLAKMWLDWLENYGFMRDSWDIERPSWAETPTALKHIIKDLFSKPELLSPKLQQVPPEGDLLREVMARDEDQRHLASRLLGNARSIILMAATILVRRGQLKDISQIFFLPLEDILRALQGPVPFLSLVAEASQIQWERAKTRSVPWILGSLATSESVSGQKLGLKGASDGVGAGPAAFARNLEEAALIPEGSILFTDIPRPEFVVVYPRLRGLVTEQGGMLSHGFVAARECGLPAVTGYFGESGHPRQGQWVWIDGAKGKVQFENSSVI